MKNVFKKGFSLLLAFTIIFSCTLSFSGDLGRCLSVRANAETITDSGTCGDNITWALNSEGTLTISGTGDMNDYNFWNSVFAPWYDISSDIKTVVISDGITSLGDWAFSFCENVTCATISESVTDMGIYTFYNCTNLSSITIPQNITTLGSALFYKCENLTSITLPKNVTSIGWYAFQNCSNLTEIIIPDGVVNIGDLAFSHCTELTSIEIPYGVKNIGICTFEYCENLTEITIPNSVTNIGLMAFYNCKKLENITIPDSVKKIEYCAFLDCLSLTSVTIPESVTTIEENAFGYYTVGKLEYEKIEGFKICALKGSAAEIYANENECAFENTCNHMAFNWIIDQEANCTTDGLMIKTCTDCGESLESTTIPATEHEYLSIILSEATCTEGCKIKEYCKICGNSYTYTDDTAGGHRYKKISSGQNAGSFKCVQCDTVVDELFPNLSDDICSLNPQDLVYSAFGYWMYYREPSGTNIDFVLYYISRLCIVNKIKSLPAEVLEAKAADHFTVSINDLHKNTSEFMRYNSSDKTYEVTDWGGVGGAGEFHTKGYTKTDNQYNIYCYLSEYGNKNDILGAFRYIIEYENNKPQFIGYESIDYKEIPEKLVADHISSKWITDKKATVNAAGSKHKECVECKEVLETAKIPQLKCATPKLKAVTNVATGIKFTWNKVTGADNYEILRKTGKGTWKKIATVKGSVTSYTDKKAKSGTTYKYTVKAKNEAGLSKYNTTGLTIKCLADPVLKTPTSAKAGITLKWSKVTGAQGYVVYRKAGNGSFKKLTTVKGASKASYIDKSAKKGTKYTYKLQAYSGKTFSAYSNSKSIKDKY